LYTKGNNMTETEQSLRQEYESLSQQLQDPSLFGTPKMSQIGRRHSEVAEVLAKYDAVRHLKDQIIDLKASLSDPELKELVEAELPEAEARFQKAEEDLKLALVPRDPHDGKDVIVEIRAGAGGDEASLFGGELFKMYARYAETKRWKVELISESPSDVGGYKEIVFAVKGDGVYGELKYESGVHRVQRIPATESGGRIHTSTVTVAVLPEAEETDIEINPNDLRIDVFRSGGNGGQSVNTTDSAVRITHLPTGTVVTCQDEKSQLKNKLKAMGVLRSRLLAVKMEEEQKQLSDQRLSQIGTGDRSEKIRTYNFPQDRITDHRIGRSEHGLPGYMTGSIGGMIEALQAADLAERLNAAGA
jgi:peptide chain release factor 1